MLARHFLQAIIGSYPEDNNKLRLQMNR